MLVVDVDEWAELAKRLEAVNGARFDELLDALREIVEAEERLAAVRRELADSRGRVA